MEQEQSPSPKPEEVITLTKEEMKSLLREAVAEAIAPIQEINQQLQAEVKRTGGAQIDPNHLEAAMSVTLATRPVIEHPDQYPGVVDPGALSINSSSPLSPKAIERAINGAD